MRSLLIVLLMLHHVVSRQFVELNYPELIDMWNAHRKNTPNLTEIDAADGFGDYRLPKNDCKGPCKYLLYEYTSPNYDPSADITVLIISGFHGDERLGPLIVTESFPYLNGRHMLFMPVVNPSGFINNKTFELPSQVDPYKDFSYSNLKKCFEGATSNILNSVYQRWDIGLTIHIRQGGQQVYWPGKHVNKPYESQDEKLYRPLAQNLVRKGGSNPFLGMKRMSIARMSIDQKQANGRFEEWVRFGSQSSDLKILTICSEKARQVPNKLTYSIVVTVQVSKAAGSQELGSSEGVNGDPKAIDQPNGFVSRGIRVLKELVSAASPRVSYYSTQDGIELEVIGCVNATVQLDAGRLSDKFDVAGSLAEFSDKIHLPWRRICSEGILLLKLPYRLLCDTQLNGVGVTPFGKKRIIHGSIDIWTTKAKRDSHCIFQEPSEDSDSGYWWAIWGIAVAVLIYMCCRCFFKRCSQEGLPKQQDAMIESEKEVQMKEKELDA